MIKTVAGELERQRGGDTWGRSAHFQSKEIIALPGPTLLPS